MSVRTYLADQIRPLLPTGWVFYDHDRTLPTVGKVTALLVHSRVEPGPQQAILTHSVVLVIVDPTQVEGHMDDRLDDHLEDLIPLLRGIPNVQFVSAERAAYPANEPTYPAWSIQLTVQTTA